MNYPQQTPESTKLALDRAVSEVFHEFGLVIPAKPQMGMVNIKSADPATFTEKITTVLQQYGINIDETLTNQITRMQGAINNGNRQAILPGRPGSYGQDLMKALQPQLKTA